MPSTERRFLSTTRGHGEEHIPEEDTPSAHDCSLQMTSITHYRLLCSLESQTPPPTSSQQIVTFSIMHGKTLERCPSRPSFTSSSSSPRYESPNRFIKQDTRGSVLRLFRRASELTLVAPKPNNNLSAMCQVTRCTVPSNHTWNRHPNQTHETVTCHRSRMPPSVPFRSSRHTFSDPGHRIGWARDPLVSPGRLLVRSSYKTPPPSRPEESGEKKGGEKTRKQKSSRMKNEDIYIYLGGHRQLRYAMWIRRNCRMFPPVFGVLEFFFQIS